MRRHLPVSFSHFGPRVSSSFTYYCTLTLASYSLRFFFRLLLILSALSGMHPILCLLHVRIALGQLCSWRPSVNQTRILSTALHSYFFSCPTRMPGPSINIRLHIFYQLRPCIFSVNRVADIHGDGALQPS